MCGGAAEEIVEVVLVGRERRLLGRPVAQPLATDREHLRLDERRRRGQLRVRGLGATEARHGGGVRRLDGVAHQRVREDLSRPPRQAVPGGQGLGKARGALAEAPLERRKLRQGGEHAFELGLPRLAVGEDARVTPGPLDRHARARNRHSGMLPCLRLGVGSRLARCISSARIR